MSDDAKCPVTPEDLREMAMLLWGDNYQRYPKELSNLADWLEKHAPAAPQSELRVTLTQGEARGLWGNGEAPRAYVDFIARLRETRN